MSPEILQCFTVMKYNRQTLHQFESWTFCALFASHAVRRFPLTLDFFFYLWQIVSGNNVSFSMCEHIITWSHEKYIRSKEKLSWDLFCTVLSCCWKQFILGHTQVNIMPDYCNPSVVYLPLFVFFFTLINKGTYHRTQNIIHGSQVSQFLSHVSFATDLWYVVPSQVFHFSFIVCFVTLQVH